MPKQLSSGNGSVRLRQTLRPSQKSGGNGSRMTDLRDLALLYIYAEARMAATAARFPVLNKVVIESAAFEEFLAAWPYPGARPAWWRAPPGVLEKAVELVRPWADGRVREQPELAHLLPAEVDYLQPWPWRADA